MYKKPFLMVVFCCTAFTTVFAQRQAVDSLQGTLASLESDSLRCIQYLHISTAFTQFNPDSAYKSAQNALLLAQSASDTVLLFFSAHQAGLCAADIGLYEQALDFQQWALKYNVRPPKTNAAGPIAAIANIFSLRNDHKAALRYGQQAYDAYISLRDTFGILNQLTNLGSIYSELAAYDKALECHQKVLAISTVFPSNFERIANNNIGRLFLVQNQPAQSIPYFEKCLAMSQKAEDLEGQLLGYANLGKAQLALKNTETALENYQKSLELANQFGDPGYQEMVWKGLGAAYEAKGDFKNALAAWKNYHTLYDSIEQTLNTDKYLKLESTFKLKEKEIELAQSELELGHQKNQRNGVLVLLLLLGGLGAVMFWFIRNRNALLERKLAAELEEAQRLQELDTLKTNFFVNISHELRTPLTLIESPLLAILGKKIPANKEHAYLKLMANQTSKMKTLLNQLLDLARVESGQTNFTPTVQNLSEILAQCAAPFREYAIQKELNFETIGLNTVITTPIDIPKIQAVVQNLLSNAFKYTQPGPLSRITLSLEATEGQNTKIIVSDNGIGLSAEQQNQLFDRYFQANPQEGSSGVGLALCREYVRLHQGEITVDSTENQGSTFAVILPPALEILGETTDLQAKSLPEPTHQPLLLIVEDNLEITEFLTSLLNDQYQILSARDGEEGLKTALETVPDLVISDIMMPKMDGIALTRKLIAHDATSHIPIFLLSAKTDTQFQWEGLESGAIDYISKPFDPVALQHKLRNALRIRNAAFQSDNTDIAHASAPLLNKRDREFLEKVYEQIDIGYPDPDFSIEDISKALFLSRSQVYRKVIALTGLSPLDILRNKRLEAAQHLLVQKSGTASEIGYTVGFNSPAYFVKSYREKFGVTPGQLLQ
jgi:signal transduction histidine kinase/CheY-like chemotaxis protein